jgi:hypothetical protein
MIKFLMKCFESELEKNKSLEGSTKLVSLVKTFCGSWNTMSFEGSVELHVTSSKALLIIGSHMPEVRCYSFFIAFFLCGVFGFDSCWGVVFVFRGCILLLSNWYVWNWNYYCRFATRLIGIKRMLNFKRIRMESTLNRAWYKRIPLYS